MKLVSFNVNSIRQREHQIRALVERHDPDVIGLQETKVVDDAFPLAAMRALGYHTVQHGQKTHYGVALLSKTPLENVAFGTGDADVDTQRRLVAADIETADGQRCHVINGYFPQGEKRSHETKFPAKRRFYEALLERLQSRHRPDEALVVLGDFNVAPIDADIGIGDDARKRWLREGKTSFLPEEREWIERLLDWGLVDTFRRQQQATDDRFSWFDYRSRGFERTPKRGLRIDHVLATEPLASRLRETGIDYDIRAMDKPSDHCPVWAAFDV